MKFNIALIGEAGTNAKRFTIAVLSLVDSVEK